MTELHPSWANITLAFYQQYAKAAQSFADLPPVDQGLSLLGWCENKTLNEMKELPLFILHSYQERWGFLNEDFLSLELKENPLLNVGTEMYVINRDFTSLSMEQWENKDAILATSPQNFFPVIGQVMAITALPRQGYTYEQAVELGEKINQLPMSEVIPNIIFFLNSGSESSNNLSTSLAAMERQAWKELARTLIKYKASIKCGVGIPRLSRWRMTIFYNLMWLYLRLSVLSSTISATSKEKPHWKKINLKSND